MTLQSIQVQDLIDTQIYENEEQVVQDALHYFLLERPDLRILAAVRRYQSDPELSLAKAAALAGVSLEWMKEILERHNVPLRLCPATLAEARAEVVTLKGWRDADPG